MTGSGRADRLVPLADAHRYVLDRVAALPAAKASIADALGLVLAEPVASDVAAPPFDNSAMDGFAVRSTDVAGATSDTPTRLRVVGTVAAGTVAGRPVGAGEALRIMTGAPMPSGADAVVIVERTSGAPGFDGDAVDVLDPVAAGANVRRAGTDIVAGEEVVHAGTLLRPAHLALLATAGHGEVSVVPRPRVGVLSTGDELVPPGEALGPGQIYDSNRLGLASQAREAGFEAVDLGCVADEPSAIETALREGVATCDALLSSGGVSMGDFDHVKVVLDRLGDMRWMQIAIKPAKPFAFGLVEGTPVFGLPGNPVSSMVSFELLARPALRAMGGHHVVDREPITAVADEDLGRRADGKTHFVRAVATWAPDGRLHVRSAGGQASYQLTSMAAANALAVLDDGPGVAAGATVPVLLLDR